MEDGDGLEMLEEHGFIMKRMCYGCKKLFPIKEISEIKVSRFLITRVRGVCLSCKREIQLKKLKVR